MKIERRDTAPEAVELRVEEREGGGLVLSGLAAVFHRQSNPGTEYQLWPGVVEWIDDAAFDRALDEGQDVRALVNHDPDHILGRTKADTLRLAKRERGLRYEIDLPDTQAGRDIAESVRRGDISGSSFAFRVTQEEWIEDKTHKREVRVIKDVDLFDVGPVVFPAYAATSAGVRADGDCDEAKRMHDEWIVAQAQQRLRAAAWRRYHLACEEAGIAPS